MSKHEKLRKVLTTLGTTLAVELVLMLLLTGTGVVSFSGVGGRDAYDSGKTTGQEVMAEVDGAAGEETGGNTEEEPTDSTTEAVTTTAASTTAKASSKTTKATSKTTKKTTKTTTTTKATTTTTKNNGGDNDGGWVEGWY